MLNWPYKYHTQYLGIYLFRIQSDQGRIPRGRFPLKNTELLQKWIVALKRKNFKLSKHSKICSSHFTVADYNPPVVCGPPRLKKDAVPSVFDCPDYLMPKQSNCRVLLRVPDLIENIEISEMELNELKPPNEATPKTKCSVGTQTTLTGDMLENILEKYRRERKILHQRLKRRNDQIRIMEQHIKLLKEKGVSNEALENYEELFISSESE